MMLRSSSFQTIISSQIHLFLDVYKEAETRMDGSIQALEDDLASIRTGRAHPGLVEKLNVEYYGVPTPLIQLLRAFVATRAAKVKTS